MNTKKKYAVLIRLLLMLYVVLISNCNNKKSLSLIKTKQLDFAYYEVSKEKYDWPSISPAPEYWGGLTPQYHLASGFREGDCQDVAWQNEGLIAGCKEIVLQQKDTIIFIKNRSELKKIFSPISSKQEALSFACAYADYFPITDLSFYNNKEDYYYLRNKDISSIDSLNSYYIVHLYDYETFGCGPHPYYAVDVKVYTSGEVKELTRNEAFRNPDTDNQCVD
ncbi:hypothetical protein [Hymenobacter defluvii]|uniref:Uncharacterized protein n=1 Tax=Hymenobacter defluvii TaxID=2054411 RepID=A0ABS3TIL7_9BACT|nr:hypothetical protein [Hymenobacter defluvii]MBO3272429.1 hypothetical protein [Hymenobacter defluvii]